MQVDAMQVEEAHLAPPPVQAHMCSSALPVRLLQPPSRPEPAQHPTATLTIRRCCQQCRVGSPCSCCLSLSLSLRCGSRPACALTSRGAAEPYARPGRHAGACSSVGPGPGSGPGSSAADGAQHAAWASTAATWPQGAREQPRVGEELLRARDARGVGQHRLRHALLVHGLGLVGPGVECPAMA